MQAAPAVTVSVGPNGAARAAFALLGGLAVACCAVWAVQRADVVGGLALMAALCLVAVSLMAWAREPVRRLRWDGEGWALGAEHSTEPPLAGQLVVAVDLDVWLLLRFRGDPASGRSRPQWLALQRSSHRGDWHALRCAVYSPRAAGLTPG
jgi:hypothetical protein